MIEAKIIKDSESTRSRLTTFELTYPRAAIHEELLTHRAFSRNASSSRAIPVERMIERVLTSPALPVFWGANRRGMQSTEELLTQETAQKEFMWARDKAVASAHILKRLGLHKQFVNLLLRPWEHITVIVSATDWDNFWKLRCHPDAKPDFRALAELMRERYRESRPRFLVDGQWHLPYIFDHEEEEYGILDKTGTLRKRSTARCARVSYLTHDGNLPVPEKDEALHDQLLASAHASPFEHAATPAPGRHGNFNNWRQYRQEVNL